MKKLIAAVGIILLFITLCFSGCEEVEVKPDYINVNCQVQAYVDLLDKYNNILIEKPVGLMIRVDIIKDGGERFTFHETVDKNGFIYTSPCTFKMYKEQPIEAILEVQGGYKDYYPTSPLSSKTLTWAQVEPTGFGGTYVWTEIFSIKLINTTTP